MAAHINRAMRCHGPATDGPAHRRTSDREMSTRGSIDTGQGHRTGCDARLDDDGRHRGSQQTPVGAGPRGPCQRPAPSSGCSRPNRSQGCWAPRPSRLRLRQSAACARTATPKVARSLRCAGTHSCTRHRCVPHCPWLVATQERRPTMPSAVEPPQVALAQSLSAAPQRMPGRPCRQDRCMARGRDPGFGRHGAWRATSRRRHQVMPSCRLREPRHTL